jgi:hypothetical protein
MLSHSLPVRRAAEEEVCLASVPNILLRLWEKLFRVDSSAVPSPYCSDFDDTSRIDICFTDFHQETKQINPTLKYGNKLELTLVFSGISST